MRKPIIHPIDTCSIKFSYKYIHTAYILNISVKFYSDLNYEQFCNFLDGKYSMEEIEQFENTSSFQKPPKIFL